MKYIYALLFTFTCNLCIAESTINNWKEKSTNDIQKILSLASKQTKDGRLSLSEVVNNLGKYNFQETKKLIIPQKVLFSLRGGKNVRIPTQEFVWELSERRNLQVVVGESFVVYAYIINNEEKQLVWK